jgi:hypothetical protein
MKNPNEGELKVIIFLYGLNPLRIGSTNLHLLGQILMPKTFSVVIKDRTFTYSGVCMRKTFFLPA